ncbi:helix-turn-helix domain-containing protein [Aeromonas veronii]|uniref:helix-turn-helix domain-containing protein n=1 Tax=Aeromonas veronii TaxID=654 RepID=UPI003BA2D10B
MEDLSLTAAELRDIRARLDWSQQRMADELGVARNTVNRMEQGRMAVERRTALAVRYLAWHHAMIEKVSRQQPGQDTPPASASERGDRHKQVDLPLAPSSSSLTLSAAQEAWAVYMPVISGHKAYSELKERYFKMAELDDGYTYLFLLQLLERLAKLPKTEQDFPVQWCNIRELRQFAKQLYKANPQWH